MTNEIYSKYFGDVDVEKDSGIVKIKCGENFISFFNGRLHSLDKNPALILKGQKNEWYYKGFLHNLCGPAAIVERDGQPHYFILNKEYGYSDFIKLSRKIKLNSIKKETNE